MKTLLTAIGILLFQLFSFSQSNSIADYFMFKDGVKYDYKSIGKDGTGKFSEISYKCFGIKAENNNVFGMFYFNSPYGWQETQTFLCSDNSIFLTYAKNPYSGGDINPIQPILKLPSNSASVKWNWGTEKFYEASFVKSIKTSSKIFNDCILVTETTKINNQVYRIEKKYFALNIGLVKIELYDNKGIIQNSMSYELISYE